MPFCTNCGHDNPEGSNFCGQCGAALNVPPAGASAPGSGASPEPERTPTGDTTKTFPAVTEDREMEALSADEEAAVGALPTGSALLIVKRGANAGSRFLLNTDTSSVGRHPDSDIFLDAATWHASSRPRTTRSAWHRSPSMAPTSTSRP
jgi:hypothetical protein